MAEGAALSFNDPDGYAAGFGDIRISLTMTGSGDFKARLIRLKLQHLDVYCCCESVRRIAYISLPPEQVFISFPVSMAASSISDGFVLRNGDLVFHSRGERTFHRTNGACQWGLISLPPEQLAVCGKALTGLPIAPPRAGAILRPLRAEVLRFQRLFAQACRLAEARNKLIELPEVQRALEQEMLHAIVQLPDRERDQRQSKDKTASCCRHETFRRMHWASASIKKSTCPHFVPKSVSRRGPCGCVALNFSA